MKKYVVRTAAPADTVRMIQADRVELGGNRVLTFRKTDGERVAEFNADSWLYYELIEAEKNSAPVV